MFLLILLFDTVELARDRAYIRHYSDLPGENMPLSDLQDALTRSLTGDEHGVRYEFSTVVEGQPAWRVREMTLREAISTPYVLTLELGIGKPDAADPFAMLGEYATFRWQRDSTTRFVHGVVTTVEQGATTDEGIRVHVTIMPAASALEHVSRSRIFQEATIPEVVKQVLEEGLAPFGRKVALELRKTDYAKREYVTQHRETDLAFVSRLLAEEGLWYCFRDEHSDQPEQLVVLDSPEFAKPIQEDPQVTLANPGAFSNTHETVTSFGRAHRLGTNAMRVHQFAWTQPELVVASEAKAEPVAGRELARQEYGDITSYGYRAPQYREYDDDHQARVRLERHLVSADGYDGESSVTSLRPGHFMRVGDRDYLVTSVSHHGSTVASTGSAAARGHYRNHFQCMPREAAYRPARIDGPRIFGPQTAIVVDRSGKTTAPSSSADGEDIVADEHGRVRVKFHWDLTQAGQGGTNSCWLRVCQSLAGAGFGFQFLPRVGMEVVVQFIDGDPDQPLITACLYNGRNRMPFETLTQSGIKTASSVDRTRYNELRFEDAKDQEQIFVRAQRDYMEEILNDHTTTVTGAQTQTVKKNQSESIHGNQSLSVGGKRTKIVGGDKEDGEEITVKGERTTTVTRKNVETFQDEHALTVVKAAVETYQDTHDRTVTGTQTLKAEADKLEHVVGTYELTTDQAFVLNQGGTKLTYEADNVALDAAGELSITCGPASATIDKGGNMELKTTGSITLQVGGNKVVLSASGIEINGTQFSIAVGPSEIALTPASSSITSVNVKVEATAICAVKGSLLNLN